VRDDDGQIRRTVRSPSGSGRNHLERAVKVDAGVKPGALSGRPVQDHRLAVVHEAHIGVRGRRDDGARRDLLGVVLGLRDRPQAREREDLDGLQAVQERLLRLLGVLRVLTT
jgi:hypothetical protein